MTVHKSLRVASVMQRSRNVLTRWERVQKLKEAGRWSEEKSVYGLPKVRTVVVKLAKKKKAAPKEGAEGAAAPGAEGAAAAAPAAGAPAAGAKAAAAAPADKKAAGAKADKKEKK